MGQKVKVIKLYIQILLIDVLGTCYLFLSYLKKKNKNNKLIYFLVIFYGYQNDCIL